MSSLVHTLVLDPLPPSSSLFISLIRSVIYQQLATKAASAIFQRLITILSSDPTPVGVLSLTPEALYAVGVSRSKARYLFNLASYLQEHSSIQWPLLSDDEILQRLTSIKGIGPWSAQICLMHYFERPDVFPATDLGIQKAMIHLYELPTSATDLSTTLQKISAPWSPYRTLASFYLWQWKRENL
ncbi:MAG: DNA-3-methyladenine glycosylase 2 family protein [Saprospiraceae bacterium]|nr:DNA-3-methyladenine glycosylase 2 family protein [Saprospiraceae bacterium]